MVIFSTRGGSWFNVVPSRVRAGFRNWSIMAIRNGDVGFRCIRGE
jgi:formylglycine-generating enzyme required for sulfatase activity